jgi:hypothetical protein
MPKPLPKDTNTPFIRTGKEYKNFKKECPNIKPFAKDLILTIVLLRRKKDVETNFKKFHNMVINELDHICKEFNYRWINSIIDTYADRGNRNQRQQALILSQYMCTLMALELEQRSAIDHYEYDANFNDSMLYMNTGACTKFSHLFTRIDNNMVDEPFNSIWFNRLRENLDRNETSFKHIAWYNNFGLYYYVTKKQYFPEFLNHRKSENLLIYNNKSLEFIKRILEFDTIKNIVLMNSWNAIKFVENINDPRVQYHFSTDLPKNGLDYDFVWFGDKIESIPEWRSIKLRNRAVLAGADYDIDAHITEKLVDYWQVPGFRSRLLKLHGDRPLGWILSFRGTTRLDVV